MRECSSAPCRHCGRPVVKTHEHGWGHLTRCPLYCQSPEPRAAAGEQTPEGGAP